MKRTQLTSGVKLSTLSLGMWQTIERMAFDDYLEMLRAAFKAGLTTLDTARYHPDPAHLPPGTIAQGSPHAEVILGRALQLLGCDRDDFEIADKLWLDRYPAESLDAQIAGMLDRLGLEYVDVLYLGHLPGEPDLAALVRDMSTIVRSGRARCWGVANWSAQCTARALDIAEEHGLSAPDIIELKVSVIRPLPVDDVDFARVLSAGVQVHASNPLEGGILARGVDATGRLIATDPGKRRARFGARVPEYAAACARLGVTPAQAALAVCIADPHVASTLFGARTVGQLRENIGAAEIADVRGAEIRHELHALFGAD
jgi:aryl-alcohol dehydrogenase-like predicted oxidoreductase